MCGRWVDLARGIETRRPREFAAGSYSTADTGAAPPKGRERGYVWAATVDVIYAEPPGCLPEQSLDPSSWAGRAVRMSVVL